MLFEWAKKGIRIKCVLVRVDSSIIVAVNIPYKLFFVAIACNLCAFGLYMVTPSMHATHPQIAFVIIAVHLDLLTKIIQFQYAPPMRRGRAADWRLISKLAT